MKNLLPRILIVEDEGLVAMLIEDMLADLGYEVVGVASSVAQANLMISAKKPDLVILDLNVRGELSYPVADNLMEKQIPFTFASGYGRKGLVDGYAHCPIIQKPFSPAELEQQLTLLTSVRPDPHDKHPRRPIR